MSLQSSFELWDSITFWLAAVGTVLLFVSAVTGVRARKYARLLDEQRTQQSAQVRLAHDRQIETLRKGTADANARVAEAQLELERLKAPRTIQNRRQVIVALKAAIEELIPFGSLRVEVFTADNHDEVTRLRDQIIDVLKEAGWDARMNPNSRSTGGIPIGGVTVEIQLGTTVAQLMDRRGNRKEYNLGIKARALAEALRLGGLDVIGPQASSNMKSDAKIEIIVGNKPED